MLKQILLPNVFKILLKNPPDTSTEHRSFCVIELENFFGGANGEL